MRDFSFSEAQLPYFFTTLLPLSAVRGTCSYRGYNHEYLPYHPPNPLCLYNSLCLLCLTLSINRVFLLRNRVLLLRKGVKAFRNRVIQ